MGRQTDLVRARKYIVSVKWIFAKTYASTAPHEYTRVREHESLKEEFYWFIEFIRKNGYRKKFGSYTYTYYNLDGYKYWTMGAPVKQTVLINRVKL